MSTEQDLLPWLIAFFVFVNMVWNIVQIWQWGKKQCRPPEELTKFDARYALMLEEIFRWSTNVDTDQSIDDILRDLHRWHQKRRDDGTRIWYIKQPTIDSIDETLQAVHNLHSDLETLRKEMKRIRKTQQKLIE